MKRSIFELLNDCKIDCMTDKKITEVNTGNYIINSIPASLQQVNNGGAYNKKDFSSSLFTKPIEKNCKHRTETGFCNRSNKQCLHFNQSTLNIAI